LVPSFTLTTDSLVILNFASFSTLAAGLLFRRLFPRPGRGDIVDEFTALELVAPKVLPSLAPGFTWRELFLEVRRLRPELGWVELETVLRRYEEYRYGNGEPPRGMSRELSRMVSALRRGRM
jgi:hypothetical protein